MVPPRLRSVRLFLAAGESRGDVRHFEDLVEAIGVGCAEDRDAMAGPDRGRALWCFKSLVNSRTAGRGWHGMLQNSNLPVCADADVGAILIVGVP
jgi:hypothetical protein